MADLAGRLANLSPEKRAMLLQRLAADDPGQQANLDEQGLVTGPVPLLPAQKQLLTRLAMYRLNYHHYNTSTMVEVAQPLNAELAKQALQHLLRHHDALRLRLKQEHAEWQQTLVEPDDDVPFSTQDFSQIPQEEQQAAIEAAAAALQLSLNITTGPIIRMAYFSLGTQQPGRLLLIVHHIASDAYSLKLLLEDFTTAYQQLSEGKPVQLPPKTTSVKRRAERMVEYAQSAEIRQELDYWFSLPWDQIVPLPPDLPEGLNAPARPRTFEVALDKEETQALLHAVPHSGGSQIRDVILTALVRVFAEWSGSRTQLFAVPNHGRKQLFDDMNLIRTVGWLSVHPSVVLQLPDTDDPRTMVRSITEQMERIPGDGLGYELLRNFGGEELAAKFRTFPGPDVIFNYLGQRHASDLLRQASESVGRTTCLPNLWKSDIQMIFAEIVDSRLLLHWEYSENVYERATLERLTQRFIEVIRSMTQSQD
jgi:non-ribosomal peptide synthase protein (TIGR01720 family)